MENFQYDAPESSVCHLFCITYFRYLCNYYVFLCFSVAETCELTGMYNYFSSNSIATFQIRSNRSHSLNGSHLQSLMYRVLFP